MPSEEQINASRENGAKSQGPVTPEGKEKISLNAYKHGLTSPIVLLAPEDMPAYENLMATVFNHYDPKSAMEKEVVQSIADTEWKLQKCTVYEAGIFAKGRLENAHMLRGPEDPDPTTRFVIIEGEIAHTYSKILTNLSLQVSRTQRGLKDKIVQFEKMRAEREIVEVAQRNMAMESLLGDPNDTRPAHPSVGSVFSRFYMIERLKFRNSEGPEHLAEFDRTWRCKSAPIRA